jgi:hypothetical protein
VLRHCGAGTLRRSKPHPPRRTEKGAARDAASERRNGCAERLAKQPLGLKPDLGQCVGIAGNDRAG